MDSYSSLLSYLKEHNQEHLIQFWDNLTDTEKHQLKNDILQTNIPEVNRYFANTQNSVNEKLDNRMEPIPEENFGSAIQSSDKTLRLYEQEGLKLIGQGKVAALLLAGGQGTRLGVNYPKGMYDVGLPSRKTLLQLQVERLLRLEVLAKAHGEGSVLLYIMTSEGTKEPTKEFFHNNNYFGLGKDNVIVFEQGMLPTFTFDGKIILEDKHKISKAPDGNGGLYKALNDRGILEDMVNRGIEYVHVYCVDNILVKVADPVFIGYCVNKNADCGAKVVEKTNPTESVGVFCKVDGKYQVVEYSEITLQTAELRNQSTGRLLFNAGNICNHFFTVDFLQQLTSGLEDTLQHHIATKKIPYVDPSGEIIKPVKPNGVKLEKFVFDVFQFSNNFAVWEVPREEDFSPLKNSDTEAKDTPTTCRNDLYKLHAKYLKKAGIDVCSNKEDENNNTFEDNNNNKIGKILQVEISPLASYAGEGLRGMLKQQLLEPVHIIAEDESTKITPNVTVISKSKL